MALQVGQSVVLGYLTEYFSIQDPSSQDTRDAYLLAAGGSCDCHVTYLIVTLPVCCLPSCILYTPLSPPPLPLPLPLPLPSPLSPLPSSPLSPSPLPSPSPSRAGLVMMALVIMVIVSHAFLLAQMIGVMARITCTGAIYQKVDVCGV